MKRKHLRWLAEISRITRADVIFWSIGSAILAAETIGLIIIRSQP